MLADEFTSFVRRVPFQPYRIVTSDGEWYDVLHTDFALVQFDAVVIGFPPKGQDEPNFERSILVSLAHVMRIEFIDPDGLARIKKKRRKK